MGAALVGPEGLHRRLEAGGDDGLEVARALEGGGGPRAEPGREGAG